MSSRAIRGPIRYNTYKIILTGNYVVVNESVVIANKTSGAATQVTLPPSLTSLGQIREVIVQDAKGDAATNNITVVPNGGDTINGGASYVMTSNYGRTSFIDAGGGNWVVSQSVAGTIPAATITNGTITNLTIGGPFVQSDVAFANAAGTVLANATALTHGMSLVGGIANAGVQLPAAIAGKTMVLYLTGANAISIWPPVNGTVQGGSANANASVTGPGLVLAIASNSATWGILPVGT